MKIVLLISFCLNLLLVFLYMQLKKNQEITNITKPMHTIEHISDKKIFKNIFIQKNDSIFRVMFNSTFEENPLQSYLLASTYYLLKKDTTILNDIKMVNVELKGIYGIAPQINLCK